LLPFAGGAERERVIGCKAPPKHRAVGKVFLQSWRKRFGIG